MKQQRTLFDNLQLLPVTSVRCPVDDGAGYPTAKVEGADPLFRPAVLEQVRLDVDSAARHQHPREHLRPPRRRLAAGGSPCPASTTTGTSPSRGRGPGRSRSPRPGPVPWSWWSTAPGSPRRGLADRMAEDIRFDARALGMAPCYDVLVDATPVGETHAMSTVGDTDAAAVTFPVTYSDNAMAEVFALPAACRKVPGEDPDEKADQVLRQGPRHHRGAAPHSHLGHAGDAAARVRDRRCTGDSLRFSGVARAENLWERPRSSTQ